MSMKKTHDVMVTTGEFKDRETGEMRKRRMQIASIFTDEESGHLSLKLDCVPAGLPDWKGWASVFPAKVWEGGARGATGSGAGAGAGSSRPKVDDGFEDDEIPF